MRLSFVSLVGLPYKLTMPFTKPIEAHEHNRELGKGDRKLLRVLERQLAKLGVYQPSYTQIEIDEDKLKREIQNLKRRTAMTNSIIERLSMITELEKVQKIHSFASIMPNITQNQHERILLEMRDITKQKDKLWEEIHTYVELSAQLA